MKIASQIRDGAVYEKCPSCAYKALHVTYSNYMFEKYCKVCTYGEQHLEFECPCEDDAVIKVYQENYGEGECNKCEQHFTPNEYTPDAGARDYKDGIVHVFECPCCSEESVLYLNGEYICTHCFDICSGEIS